ncbi:MAG: Pyoverdin chromophore biosynthetic protein pvcC [Pseudonocardiales bacterium]|nr:Pyoverdin chromophore biosynthetic protein pvcC [Pseudonocardiales bacterium]MBV9030587.1 Pyoverdin chromophore biosynthetic protein pvcC [Pseudonocardiales bacterium]MBW0010322.1 Pyoverdin chromophore biosynthetic protein pvcC [Pseudonocardiales bacterium]
MISAAQPLEGTDDASNDLLTGDAYLESMRNGREVYLYGERVSDVTRHPAFAQTARSTAHLYDALHDPATVDVMTTVDAYTGARVHRFFTPAHAAEDLLKARDAIELWARLGYGFMNRTPDYKASFMAGLAVTHDFYEPFGASARGWYEKYARQALSISHAIVNPPVDRNKPAHEVGDVFVRVVEERDGGIVVDGAKLMGTASALTHAAFVGQIHLANLERGKAEDLALAFMAPLDTPGMKVVCRPSYELKAHSPFDNPLSSRFDENDAVLVFDKAFIPWENVLIYRDTDKVREYFPRSGLLSRGFFQGAIRMAVKLEFMAGLLDKGTQLNGTHQFRGVQTGLGELLAWRHVTHAITTAMATDPEPGPNGTVLPKMSYAAGYRALAPLSWARTHLFFEEHLAAALLMTPAGNADLKNEELRPLIDRYYRGSAGTAEERIKLFKLAWDALGTEFGGRHELYELNYAGSPDQVRLDTLTWSRAAGLLDDYGALVDQCMGDYDIDGWTRGRWSE